MRPDSRVPRSARRRLKAMRLLEAGESYRSVARRVHASLSSLVRWRRRYQDQGKAALAEHERWGRPPHLNEEQVDELLEILTDGPLARGYVTNSWTLKRIGRVIRQEFGVRYSIPGLFAFMHRALGWTCQKPTKQARERNERAIRYWRNRVWPRIKKSPRPGSIYRILG